jgi:hypothetical protein
VPYDACGSDEQTERDRKCNDEQGRAFETSQPEHLEANQHEQQRVQNLVDH